MASFMACLILLVVVAAAAGIPKFDVRRGENDARGRERQIEKRGSRNCQCDGEGFSDAGYGSGTRFWVTGCSAGWYDCNKGSGFMSKCCRENGK